jgi:hypothetical protein
VETACGATTQTSAPYDFNCDGTDEIQSHGQDCMPDGGVLTCTMNGSTCTASPPLATGCSSYSVTGEGVCGDEYGGATSSCGGSPCMSTTRAGVAGTQACH